MRRKSLRLGILAFVASTFPLFAVAEEPHDAVQTALDEMHRWIGEGDKGQGWRRFLRSQDLKRELTKGQEANAEVVNEILELYSGETNGLDRAQFVGVRRALEVWSAELNAASKPVDLPGVAEKAKGTFTPVSESRIQTDRKVLRTALDRLERFLSRGRGEHLDNWKEYLKWEALETQLAAENGPDLAVLQPILQRFFANHTGLELNEFRSVRSALRDYVNTVLYNRRPNLRDDYEQRIDGLVSQLSAYLEQPSSESAAQIGRALGWLEAGGLGGSVVAAVRRQHWHPNLYVQVSEPLIASGIEDDVQESNPINEVILGTRIHGNAELTGRLGFDLLPDQDRGSFNITLKGHAQSRNVGYNGPVTIYSDGATEVNAAKQVYLDSKGLTADRTRAWCSVDSTIRSIAARWRFIQRIAWSRASASKPQAERIAANRASARIARRMDARAAEILDKANHDFEDRFRNPLLRRDAFPQSLRFRSSDDNLFAEMLQVGRYQLGANSTPPDLAVDHDLAVRLHQSLIANFAESLLGGRTLTDEKVVQLLQDADLEVPEELEISADKDPWSITFASGQPVTAEFSSDQVKFSIRGRRFTRGEQEVRIAVQISAKYQLGRGDQVGTLIRDGEVSVEYENRKQIGLSQVAMKTFLRKKFDSLFEATIVVPDLTLPGNWKKAGELRLQQLASSDGWLTIGWLQLKGLRTANREDL